MVQIDHVLMFVQPYGETHRAVLDHGLRETYRRRHHGQGTANVCFAFDNLYLELLWIEDAAEATSPRVRRMQFHERSLWPERGNCPFGLALRGVTAFAEQAGSFWRYEAPFLPPGTAIRVARSSDDAREPLIFESPGGAAPIHWPPDRRGTLQHQCGWHEICALELRHPRRITPSGTLQAVTDAAGVRLCASVDDSWRLRLTAADAGGAPALSLELG